MKSFEDIMDNIDTLVSEGKLSEESANSIADSFYDRYMTEANAFNKAVDIYKKKGLSEMKKSDKLFDIAKTKDDNDPMQKQLLKACLKKDKKADDISRKLGVRIQDNLPPDEYDVRNKLSHVQKRLHNSYSDNNLFYSVNKHKWMRNHGNTGVSPEKKYKAGRYLALQKIGQESSLEDEINGLGIACEAGLISEDFLPILLEAVDSYLE